MDDLYDLSQSEGPEADARPIIKKYAQMFMRSAEMSESGIMYRAGVKKYGKEGMKKIPDCILLLAWNFKEEIIEELRHTYNWSGKVILPLPNDPEIIDIK